MDWTKVTKELAKDLDRSKVKPPAPGRYGEYIEGWWAIDEANRVFGFGGWSHTLVNLREVHREKVTLQDKQRQSYEQWRVTYEATVQVTVDGAVRQGVGYGHGQAKPNSLGDAIESAGKEAETDALKRALRTFGYRFGLALYDKTKTHVSDDPGGERLENEVAEALAHIPSLETLDALKAYWTNLYNTSAAVDDPRVIAAKDKRKAELSQQKKDAA